MFCFITALKSKAVSKDWARVCELFESALRSANQQTDPDFRIIVVCHEKPDVRGTYDDRVQFVSVGFPPPPPTEMKLLMLDKWKKLAVGVREAERFKPDFIMFQDADDLVSRRIVAHAHANRSANGFVIRRGYEWVYGKSWITLQNELHCGTDSIVNTRLFEYPKDLAQETVERCLILRYGHTQIEQECARRGAPLLLLPFRGAIYTV